MEDAVVVERGTLDPEAGRLEEERMVQEERWREVYRMAREEQLPIAEIARRLDLGRKTVRRCLKQTEWQPYQRSERTDTLLVEHAEFLRERAPAVRYSAHWERHRVRGGGQPATRFALVPARAIALQVPVIPSAGACYRRYLAMRSRAAVVAAAHQFSRSLLGVGRP